MNNQGWGLRTMVFFTCILLFALIIVIIQIQKGFEEINTTINTNPGNSEVKPSYSSYDDIEFAMIRSAATYVSKYYSENFLEGDYITVPLVVLQDQKMISEINDIKDKTIKCSGYVGFIKENDNVSYEPYLKCGKKYTTKGYIERHDEIR